MVRFARASSDCSLSVVSSASDQFQASAMLRSVAASANSANSPKGLAPEGGSGIVPDMSASYLAPLSSLTITRCLENEPLMTTTIKVAEGVMLSSGLLQRAAPHPAREL